MMTPSTLDMTDLEETVEVEVEIETQTETEACGASTGEIHDADDVEGQESEEQKESADGEPSQTKSEPTEPENLSAWEHDLLTRIRKQEQRVAMAENEVEWRKESLKEAKASFEGEVSMLRRLICQRDEKLPLFDGPAKKTVEASEATTATAATEESQAAEPNQAPDDSWREVEISSLDIADSLATKLYESSIETIGDLTDWQSSGKQLTDIKGVGQAKADKIADALELFWQQNPQYTR